MDLEQAANKIRTGARVTDIDKAEMFKIAVVDRTHSLQYDMDNAEVVLEHMVIHDVHDKHREEVKDAYILVLAKKINEGVGIDLARCARLVIAHIIDKVYEYAQGEMKLLNIELKEEDLLNSREKCWEEMVYRFETQHLAKVAESYSGAQMVPYCMALAMNLLNKSLGETSKRTGLTSTALRLMSTANNWTGLKRGLGAPITQVVEDAFEVERRLDSIRVHPFAAAIVDSLGTDIVKRLRSGEGCDLPIDKEIKLFNETASMLAKITGETVERHEVGIGLSTFYKKLDEMESRGDKALPIVEPEYKLIE